MMTIYRGYEIKKNAEGAYELHSGGSFAPVTKTFPNEEAAMDHADGLRRAQLRQNKEAD